MYEFYPYFTNDGSVGLYSPDVDDIYHSTYGALSEAYEKFIIPSELKKYFKKNNEIKILDICFGIGYNSKSFLNYFIKNIYNETIGSNNIKYNEKLYTNNGKYKIFIHAVDKDEILASLSPFFISNKNRYKNNKLSFKQDKILKMLSQTTKTKYNLEPETKIIFFNLIKNYINKDINNILFSKKYKNFFDKNIVNLWLVFNNMGYKLTSFEDINAFLHNIYYRYISKSHKRALNCLKNIDFTFKLSIDDARTAIKNDTTIYNYIFLDAFTPKKCPCLWTVDFFKLLYEHLDSEGMILTYSNSAQIRNAFLNAGFLVGKIYSKEYKKYTGTIAVKNKTLIKHELSEYDLGLINSKAGIFYRDKNLSLQNEAINAAYESDVKNSDLISSSAFIKSFKKEFAGEKI